MNSLLAKYTCSKTLASTRVGLVSVPFMFALILAAGCNGTSDDNRPEPQNSLTQGVPRIDLVLGVVGDPEIGSVFARQWSANHESNLTVINIDSDKFIESDFKFEEPVDVIVYPVPMLGELVSRRRIEEVPYEGVWNDTETVNTKEMLRHSRRALVSYRKTVFAMPLGSPVLTMMYRQDVLDAIDANIPETWEQFDALVEKLAAAETLEDETGVDLPTTIEIPLSGNRASQMFLARVAARVRARGTVSVLFDRTTMTPLIDTDPFVRALSEMKTIHADINDLTLTPADTYRSFVSGKTAVAFGWPSAAMLSDDAELNGPDSDSADSAEAIEGLRFARVPGSNNYFDQLDGWIDRSPDDSQHVDVIGFDGLSASISSNSENALAAQDLLRWLPGKMNSVRACPGSVHSAPFRASHLADPNLWTGNRISNDAAREYAELLTEANSTTVCLMFPRIPSRKQYLAALDDAVISVLNGSAEPEAALKSAAEKWNEITEGHGTQSQAQALKSSQGL